MYIRRGAEARLIEAVQATPVVVFEGARAVGKSTMCKELVRRGALEAHVSLTDPTVRDQAERDLHGWLSSLARPAVVDEAQLIAELPLAVKDLVDRRGGPGHFVLTGSASIGRAGLGGSDPLTGRAVRIGLSPLSQMELLNPLQSGAVVLPSVVDALFEGTPHSDPGLTPVDRSELARRMTTGGFPLRAVGTGRVNDRLRRAQIGADIDAALGEVRIGDERIDAVRARDLLRAIAAEPGGLLNISKLSTQLEMARATVGTYLSHLEHRFLVHRLDNFGARPRMQSVGTAHPKMHPVDTALSVAILDGMGRPFRSNPELFGALLETFVVNELVAQTAWSHVQPELGFWRAPGRRGDAEVDLVLRDEAGRTVGVEVKASSEVRASDATGLLTMRSAQGLHRGFVVYQGAEVVSLGEAIWAVPLAALSTPTAWDTPQRTRAVSAERRAISTITERQLSTPLAITPPVASVFVSYVHADDDYENGAILALAERLADTYEFLFGDRLDVFSDSHLRWGENWRSRIATEIETTTFLLAIVTPRFLNSQRCRDEVIQFVDVARSLGRSTLVLPLIWRRPRQLDDDSDDLVVQRLSAAQWVDVGELRSAEPNSVAYRDQLEALAERLHETVIALDPALSPTVETPPSEVDEPDLLELAEKAEQTTTEVADGLEDITNAINRITDDLSELGTPAPTSSSARMMRAWATRTGEVMEPAATQLTEAVTEMRRRWNDLDEVVVCLVRLAGTLPAEQRADRLNELLDPIQDLQNAFDELMGSSELVELGHNLTAVVAASRRLRPLARSVESALALITEMRASTEVWLGMREQ